MRILLIVLMLMVTFLWAVGREDGNPIADLQRKYEDSTGDREKDIAKAQQIALYGDFRESYDIETMKINTTNLIKMIDDSINSIPNNLNCNVRISSMQYKAGGTTATVGIQYECRPNLDRVINISSLTEYSSDNNTYIQYPVNKSRSDVFPSLVLQHLQEKSKQFNVIIGLNNLNGTESKYVKKIRVVDIYNYPDYTAFQFHYEKYSENFEIPLEDLKKLKYNPFIIINGTKFTAKTDESTKKYTTLYDQLNSKKLKTIKYLKYIDEKYFNHLDQYVSCEFNKQEIGEANGNGLINVTVPYTCTSNNDLRNAFDFDRSEVDESYVKRYFIRAAQKSFLEVQLSAYHTKLKYPIFYLFSGNWGVPNNDKEYIFKGLQSQGNVRFQVDYNSLHEIKSVQSKIHGTTKNDHLIKNIEVMTPIEVDNANKKILTNYIGGLSMFYQGRDVFSRIAQFKKCQEQYTKAKTFTSQQQITDQLTKQCLKK